LSETEGVLWKDGDAVLLTPKAFDLLLALVKARGQVLTKKELLQTVWPGIRVGEGNLPTQIGILRGVVGEGHVETVPKRGYRFATIVTEKWEEQSVPAEQADTVQTSTDPPLESPDSVEVAVSSGRLPRRWYFRALLAAAVVTVCAIFGLAIRSDNPSPKRPLVRSATGRLLAQATSEGGRPLELKLDHVPTEVLITPDGKKLYAFEYPSRTIAVLDCSSLRVKGTIALPSAARAAVMTRDGKRIYVGSLVEGVMIVGTERDRVLDRALPTGGPVYSVAVTPDEKKVFVAMMAAGLKRISTRTGESKLLSGIACPISVDIDPDGSELYVSYQCGGPGGRSGHDVVEIYDVNSEKTIATVNGPPIVGGGVSFAPNAPYTLLSGTDACIVPSYDHIGCPSVPSRVYHLFSSAGHKIGRTFAMPEEEGAGVFSPDGVRILFVGGSLSVLNPLKDTLLERYARVGEKYGKAAFSPAGNRAFIPVSPTGILVLDTLDPGCLPPTQGVFNLYSADGTLDDERQTQPLVAEGGLEFAPGLIGQAFHFNGKNSRARVQARGACGECGESWSESLYVKFSAQDGLMTILDRAGYHGDPELRLSKSGDNRVILETGDNPNQVASVSTSAPISAEEWHHLAVVTDSGTRILYVDGAMIGRIQAARNRPNPPGDTIWGAYVGANHDRTQFLNGLVDELAFYNRALSASEIEGMYELTLHRPCSLARPR
jgi:DNA-binding winged helix-turn-helix (wHTH) protein/DNA-binding beta-propeller fold protein YncE